MYRSIPRPAVTVLRGRGNPDRLTRPVQRLVLSTSGEVIVEQTQAQPVDAPTVVHGPSHLRLRHGIWGDSMSYQPTPTRELPQTFTGATRESESYFFLPQEAVPSVDQEAHPDREPCCPGDSPLGANAPARVLRRGE